MQSRINLKSKKFYAYLVPGKDMRGITEQWSECEKIVRGQKGARYKSFKTQREAEEWLRSGGDYKSLAKKIEAGIYFDAGTGRGQGVEVSVTDERGRNLLHELVSKKFLNKYGKLLLSGKTNNYGELLACRYALELAIRNGQNRVFGDSKLIISYWSKGIIKKDALPVETVELAYEVRKLRREFENSGGKLEYVSGDVNPADLGFH
jgi:ribonuclease HI